MSTDILIRYTGSSNQPILKVNGDGDHVQIMEIDHDKGAIKVLFTGAKFSAKEYERRGGAEQEAIYSKIKK